jgi:Ca-activated chloride channel family protein
VAVELELGEEAHVIGFELLRADLLWLPPLALVVLVVGVWGLRRRVHEMRRLVRPPRLAAFLPGYSRNRAWTRLFLAALALALIGFSALGPVRGFTQRDVVRRGLDIVVCLDTSRSMLARDLRPSRLERATREVVGLLERLRGDRCSLIAFSGDAREIAPLTHDRSTLRSLLGYVSPADNRRGGTDLATAIERALEMFDGRTGAHEAIVLLTDGEDLEGRAAELAGKARERGIGVYVVGIGTEDGGKIPVLDARGRESFLIGPDGEEVVTRLAGESLRAIAERTGGAYLSAESSPTPLEDLYTSRISKLEGRELEGGKRRIPHDRYQWSLALALACMLVECGLRERHVRRTNGGVS